MQDVWTLGASLDRCLSTEHRNNDDNIQSMYHSSATSRATSSRLRNRLVMISARRADRAAVICCCWVARRAVTCMRPHYSSQHSIVGPTQSCMMRYAALHVPHAQQGVSRRTGSEETYRIYMWVRTGAEIGFVWRRRLPTCDASPKNTTPVCGARDSLDGGACVRCPVARPRRDLHCDTVSRRLQPASFVRPALAGSQHATRPHKRAGQDRPV